MACRFVLWALSALFVLSCSKEPPLSSDFPRAAASNPAGKATDDECSIPLCHLLGDPDYTIPDGQGGHEAPEEEEENEAPEAEEEAEPTSMSITLTAQPATVREDDGVTTITITATLDGAAREEDTTVIVAISLLSTAERDMDYAALVPPSITIPAGSKSGSIEVRIEPIADSLVEGSESIQLIGILEGISTFVEITLSDSRAEPSKSSQDGDRAALVSLYRATGGDNWTKNDNWLSNRSLSTWYGVETNAQGRVTRLSLWNNRLNGQIPSELGRLEKLEFLWLHSNQLSGSIPSQLGQLANLTQLGLHNNQLSGSIPSQLGQLTNLIELSLFNNRLSGSIPPQLGRLRKLQWLFLFSNQLSGSIPPELGRLTNLEVLELQNNRLSGSIPSELGQLTNLEGVFLSGNRLTGCLPSVWRNVRYDDLDKSGLSFCSDTTGPSRVGFNIDVRLVDDSFTSN
ncbi:MAG: leucine-rich repeat domain-containing protein, partial [Candidatus Poribacteria bacterium]|nr:leucine-rich repeat domain-containing protein [Candidatus Poribacteria bacterium]